MVRAIHATHGTLHMIGTALNSDNATAGSIYGGGGGSGFSSGATFTGKAGAQGAIKISWG